MNISKYTTDDLKAFNGKKIVIYNSLHGAKNLYNMFRFYKMDILAICDDNTQQTKYKGIPIVTKRQLKELLKKHNDVIIQPTFEDINQIERTKNEFLDYNVTYSPLLVGKLQFSFNPYIYIQSYKRPLRSVYEKLGWSVSRKAKVNAKIVKNKLKGVEYTLIACLPPKTGDTSLDYTFAPLPNVQYINLGHRPQLAPAVLASKKEGVNKIITAVREPISQNLSSLYQGLSIGFDSRNWLLGYAMNATLKPHPEVLRNEELLLVNDYGDIQKMFDAYIKRYIYSENNLEIASTHARSIQKFMPEFTKYVLDITAYPFNQEKGYAIIKQGNTEVFVFQIEKLNHLVAEIAAWSGIPIETLKFRNQASDKWIAASYKQAQNQIEITQEYFDKCFDEPYVKHCYSKTDIEKFKMKWAPNIKKQYPSGKRASE